MCLKRTDFPRDLVTAIDAKRRVANVTYFGISELSAFWLDVLQNVEYLKILMVLECHSLCLNL